MDNKQGQGVSRRKFLRNAGVVGAAGAAVSAGAVSIGTAVAGDKGGAKCADCDYDVVVIGGGFAGVTAARESMKNGYKTVILEARNRLGGRTFSSEFAGHKVELGGTWIHWTQPNVWAEVQRYGLELKETPEPFVEEQQTVRIIHEGKAVEPKLEELIGISKAVKDFFADAPKLWERPYDAKHTWEQLLAVDGMTGADRFAQLKLTPLERSFIDAYVAGIAHTTSDRTSYLETARWWSLPGWNMTAFVDACGRYSFKDGTISLINAMIEDGKPQVRLSTPVAKVEEQGKRVLITTEGGEVIRAGAVIVTVPMNVLPRIAFTPALDPALVQAAEEKHTGSGIKVFVRTKGKLPEAGKRLGLAGSAHPINILATYAKAEDHTLFVGFGADPAKLDIQDRDAVQAMMSSFYPDLEVEACYGYEWTLDPYARGTYCSYKPNWIRKYYDHFQKDRGRVVFGQGDHGEGWRGFIDGAISAGSQAALRTHKLLG
ncbi:FAD-dependent oxidoreductase [Pseudomonas umsongensis]|jgi:monoamine oxidase|uniref:Monoamine oxidase n=1 Tax=Pseudomonas umsongensis TaxID=198618 RepID=A0ABX4E123_9PSED|nr:NAD(P)/FAD-dependent oxidoreductase [Pseudomonas umsongensis]OXR35133.1 monoamine oxidase [Pseudomonas umsongensis]QFG30200.1 FAD-dependent oxidoreductase [Pseudomonas umsongensis]SDT23556.1 Monoamine oxidase [Pseudomonas umsongensis]